MTFGSRLSRRERQIMDILYRLGQASAAEVLDAIADPPSYSAIRALLRILEEKGQVRHTRDGARYVFAPAEPRSQVAHSALSQVVQNFFGGNVEQVVASLISDKEARLSEDELDRLSQLIDQAREGGH